jgi:hypothetical protein
MSTANTTLPEPLERPIPPDLGVAKLSGASAFICRYYPQEWVLMAQRKAKKHLTRICNSNGEIQYQFDVGFRNPVFKGLLRLARAAVVLLNDQPCQVEVGSGLSFDETVMKDRALEIGGFPTLFPHVNDDKMETNPLEGVFSKKEALFRAKVVQETGLGLLKFINRAFNIKGQSTDETDPWDFHEMIVPAQDQCLNATYPDSIQCLAKEEWDALVSAADAVRARNLAAQSSNSNTNIPPYHYSDLGDIRAVFEEYLNQAPSQPASAQEVETTPAAMASPTITPAPAPTPAPVVEDIPGLDPILPEDQPAPALEPFDFNQDALTNALEASLIDYSLDHQTLADEVITQSNDNNTNQDHEVIDIDTFVNNDTTPAHFPTFTSSTNFVHATYAPYLYDQAYGEDCPCGMHELLLRAYAHGRRDEYDELKQAFDQLNTVDHAPIPVEEVIKSEDEESNGRELILHPIHSSTAKNALIRYSPYPSRLLRRV